jgi:hypothetical protein
MKDRLKWLWRRVRKVKVWQLLAALAVLLITAVIGLRANNQTMVDLRQALIEADKTGQAAEIQESAAKLRDYVSGHMNTDTGPVPLQNSYNIAVETAFRAANDQVTSAGYEAATEACKAQIASAGYQGYANCVANAVGLSDSDFATPELPNPALFYISYASPLLSADLAGVATTLAFVVFFAIVLRFISGMVVLLIWRLRGKTLKTS